MTIFLQKVGAEFLVNTAVTNDQRNPSIAALANGDFVVSWETPRFFPTFSPGNIAAQLFSSSGAKIGSEFILSTDAFASHERPAVTGLSNGGFVASWYETYFDGFRTAVQITTQVFDAGGNAIGAEQVLPMVFGAGPSRAAIDALADGGFVVVREAYVLGVGGDIVVQRFDAAGMPVGAELRLDSTMQQFRQAVAGLADGGFVVSWTDDSRTVGDASGSGVKAQIFGADGARIGDEFLVNTKTIGSQGTPTITALSTGGCVISWADRDGPSTDGNGTSVTAQIFDSAGGRVGIEFLVNSSTVSGQDLPDIASLAGGGFVVTWSDASGTLGDASSYSIKAQVFDAQGNRIDNEFLVNTATSGPQILSSVAGLPNGGFVVTWQDPSGTLGDASGLAIKAQVFELASAANTPPRNLVLDNLALLENTATGTAVATASAQDAESPAALIFTLGDDAGGRFAIDAATGVVRVADASRLDREAASGHAITVVVTDQGGLSTSASFTIALGDVDEFNVSAPFDIDLAPNRVAAGAAPGTLVGFTARAIDADATSNGVSYALVDDAGGRFRINAVSGAVVVASGALLLAADASYQIIVRATSADGSVANRAFGITVDALPATTSFVGTAAADVFTATAAGDWFVDGKGGSDTLTTLAGNDMIVGGLGNDSIAAGDGNDIIGYVGTANGFDTIDGGAGSDELRALAPGTVIGIAAIAGIERITANGFAHVGIAGSGGADVLDFSKVALTGIAAIRAGGGNDIVVGTAAANVIEGGTGNDSIAGGGGNDVFGIGKGDGFDAIDGGNGIDRIVATAADTRIGLSALTGVETIDSGGFTGVSIIGTGAGEQLDFSGVALVGIVAIGGGGGDDSIIGSAGGDVIKAGAGRDVLTGGGGGDVFDFDAVSDSRSNGFHDLVTDFGSGADIIDLATIDADTGASGNQAFDFIGAAAFGGKAGELRYQVDAGGFTRIFGDTDGNGVANFEIRLTGMILLEAVQLVL